MKQTQTQWEVSKENKIKQVEVNEQKYKDLQLACSEIFSGNNGRFVLSFLKEICLWDKQSDDITPTNLIYEKARRDIWIILRTLIPKNVLSEIEAYKQNKE